MSVYSTETWAPESMGGVTVASGLRPSASPVVTTVTCLPVQSVDSWNCRMRAVSVETRPA